MYDEIIVLGVLLSLIFSEATSLVPGGIIVPVYLALCLDTPERIAYTLVIVMLTYLLLQLLSRCVILYGRRRFALAVVLSFLLNWFLNILPFAVYQLDVIGCLVPGIMVREMERQGVGKTLIATGAMVGIMALVLMLVRYL